MVWAWKRQGRGRAFRIYFFAFFFAAFFSAFLSTFACARSSLSI